MKGYPTACSTPAKNGMKIITNDVELRELRRDVLKLTLSEHPFSCLVCENSNKCEEEGRNESKAGRSFGCFFCSSKDNCDLREISDFLEIDDVEYQLEYKNSSLKRKDPFIEVDPNMCILCGKCVRMCNEMRNIGAINLVNRGHDTKVSTAFDLPLIDTNCQFCGACVDICPTGAITSKNTKWFDKNSNETASICGFCGIGCRFDYFSSNEVLVESIPNKINYTNNKYPCLFGRFCIVPFNNGVKRLKYPLIKFKNELIPSGWDEAYTTIKENLIKFKPDEIAIIASIDLSNESAYILNKFANKILKTNNIIISAFLNNKNGERYLWRNANLKGVLKNILLNNKKSQEEIIKDIRSGKIKALYLTERLYNIDILQNIEYLIIQDIYPSKCFKGTDIVLPTCTFIEDSGSFFNSDQISTQFFQATSRIGESKPDWQIFCELAKKFDDSIKNEFNFSSAADINEEITKRQTDLSLTNSENLMDNFKLPINVFEEIPSEFIITSSNLDSFKYRGETISNQVEDLKVLLEYQKSKTGVEKSDLEIKKIKKTRFKVISNNEIAINFFKLVIQAPLIARKAKPGNFVILMKEEISERIPLTISDWDSTKGTITLYFQEAGYSTMELTDLNIGDYLYSVVGPLGTDIEIKNFGTVLLAGGCYGNGAIYPIAKALKSAGNRIIVILEARNENLFYLEKEFEEISDNLVYCTSDGSKGLKGKILTGLEHIYNQGIKLDRAYFIGCTFMMRDASNYTKENGNIPTFVSLNSIMIDGTGMCGCCRLTLIQDGKEVTKFACIDGPIFNGHHIKWDELFSRNERFEDPEISIYQTHSCKAIEKFNSGDIDE
jgi:NADH dehydrogenase/NADH:ubiquinone oxidoreductase subunit G